jgi:multiple sugar transport system permease protein
MPLRRRAVWLAITAVAFLIPTTLLMLGRFLVFKETGMNHSLLPLMAPALLGGSPLFILLYVWAFLRIPRSLFEGAEIEGASAFQIWFRVAMPMVWPVTVAIAVLAFLLTWNDFLAPLLYLSDPSTFTLPLHLRVLSGVDVSNTPLLLAGALVATVPVLVASGIFHGILPRIVRRMEA